METPLKAATCRQLLRKAMPIVETSAYFDHAAVAPISGPAAEALADYAADFSRSGDLVWPAYAGKIEQFRGVAARMLNAQPAEIGWIANTTQGINFVAAGLDWRAGDNIVTLGNEFPSNIYPWQQQAERGVETRLVHPAGGIWTVDQVLAACDARTRLISVSWIGFASGFRGPVEELTDAAHARGIRVFLDAIQGIGILPLDIRRLPVDFLAADGHKWMLGPEGAGILYIAEEALNCLTPMNVGWNSVVGRYDFDHLDGTLRPTAARYEGGTQNVPGVVALGTSLELLLACGHAHDQSLVGAALLENVEELAESLRRSGAVVHWPRPETPAAQRSGIVSFDLPGRDLASVRDHCAAQRTPLSYRGGRLRASPHAYMNGDDVTQLLDAIRHAAS